MENEKKNTDFESAQDFEFVQQDASIHDQKFETKPTTYFKDAMKRFVKNRSSVVAGCILFVLIAMAIIVPVANKNDIDNPVAAARYLPPKWFDGDTGGFMDGTGYVENAILDPSTNNLPSDSYYKSYAVIGDIESTQSYSDTWDESVRNYGKNGAIRLGNGSSENEVGIFESEESGLLSPVVQLALTDSSVSYEVTFYPNSYADNHVEGTEIASYIGWVFETSADTPSETEVLAEESTDTPSEDTPEEGGEEIPEEPAEELTIVPLMDPLSLTDETTSMEVENVVGILQEGGYLDGASEQVSGRFAIVYDAPVDAAASANSLYIQSVQARGTTSSVGAASFSNATQAYASLNAGGYSRLNEISSTGIYHSEVTYGAFRYDYYEAAFGDVAGQEFTKNDIDTYVSHGWIESLSCRGMVGGEITLFSLSNGDTAIDWSKAPMTSTSVTLVLTEEGDTYCPLRSIQTLRAVNLGGEVGTSVSVYGTQSLYRLLYEQDKIGSCKMPKYFFGTDRNGKDFFKLVFSGLLTSLGLGLLSSAINIVIGLIWGAISGYFGGWVDMLMERFCEILGGMPFIVMMTLIVLLLGSNFWTFLLALCLTGWMGVAAETRRQFYRYKRREYVLASRTLGASDTRLIFKHILPNGIGPIITGAILMIPSVIFTEANISYLLPSALAFSGSQSFGITLSNVQGDLQNYPYLIVSASIVMALIMICFNLFGNGLRDAFNPALKGADE